MSAPNYPHGKELLHLPKRPPDLVADSPQDLPTACGTCRPYPTSLSPTRTCLTSMSSITKPSKPFGECGRSRPSTTTTDTATSSQRFTPSSAPFWSCADWLTQTLQEHLTVIPKLAMGVIECQSLMKPEETDKFMNTLLRSVCFGPPRCDCPARTDTL